MQLMGSYDNQQYLYLCREDKKCNVFFLPLYKHFYVTRAEWSNLFPFRTYHKGIYTPGQAIMEIKISSHDHNFTFSPLLPTLGEYVPGFPAFSLRAGRYSVTVKVHICEPLNTINDKEFAILYDETFPFFVPEYGDVVLTLFASLGAKYTEREKYNSFHVYRDLVENRFEHAYAILNGDQAREFYKWWDSESNLIKTVPYGKPYPSPGTVSTPKSTTVAAKPTTPPKSVATPKTTVKPTAGATTSTKSTSAYSAPKTTAKTATTKTVSNPTPTYSKPIKPKVPIQQAKSNLPTQKLEIKTSNQPKTTAKPTAATTPTKSTTTYSKPAASKKPVAAPKKVAKPAAKPTPAKSTTYSKPTPPKTPIPKVQSTLPTQKLELQKREYPKMELQKREYPKMELKKRF
ncbi:MAG: hypothetical protein IJY38_01170 [Clostridia bacterium]|nr:hypothetical protein [Clostridia bacterium]